MDTILITGYGSTTNKRYIKELLYNIKNKFDDVIILGRGNYNTDVNSIDYLIKRYSTEFDLIYIEYTPSYKSSNLYTDKSYYIYSKDNRKYYMRNTIMVKRADIIFYLIDDVISHDMEVKDDMFLKAVNKHKIPFKLKMI